MHRLGAVLLAALMAIGCGSDSGPRSLAPRRPRRRPRRPRTRSPTGSPRRSRARSPRPTGIRLEAPDYRDVTSRLASEQELYLIVVTGEHADALRRLHPREDALRRYFDRFTEDGYSEAGEAMLDWLRAFRRATVNADADHVVVLPVLD